MRIPIKLWFIFSEALWRAEYGESQSRYLTPTSGPGMITLLLKIVFSCFKSFFFLFFFFFFFFFFFHIFCSLLSSILFFHLFHLGFYSHAAKATTPSTVSSYNCDGCEKKIATGRRYHCHACQDFDLCEACKEVTTQTHLRTHTMFPINIIPLY